MTYRSFLKKCFLLLCLAAVGCAAETAKPAEPVSDSPTEIAEITDLVAKYAESVDDADTKLAAEIWATTPDVTFIHPAGHEHGWEEVKTNLYTKLMGEMFSERKLTPKNILVHTYSDTTANRWRLTDEKAKCIERSMDAGAWCTSTIPECPPPERSREAPLEERQR